MSPNQFATAVGMVESNGDRDSELGDGGRAAGRFQMHPDWVWTWATHLALAPQLNETWDSFFERLIEGFYKVHPQLSPLEAAMAFHLGHITHLGNPDWDTEYATRFAKVCITVSAPKGTT